MIIRRLTKELDWSFGHGKSDLLSDDDAIMLNIYTRLNEWVGDCFFAVQNGVDWYNGLDRGMKEYIDRRCKQIIIESFGVVQLITYESNLNVNTRKLTINASITTINSDSVKRLMEINI